MRNPRGRAAPSAALILPVLVLAILAGCTGPGRTPLRILYTGSFNGNLDGCTCPYHPRSGLVKAAAWLRSSPERTGALLVDAGDLLAAEPDSQLAYEMVETFRDLGYDAVAVGDQEIVGGIDPLRSFAQRIPFLAGNLVLPEAEGNGWPDREGELVLRRAGWTVGLFSLLDPAAIEGSAREAARARLVETGEAARGAVARLARRRVDLTVLLFHGPLSAAVDLVREVPGIDVAIVAHEQELVLTADAGGTIIASPGEEGNWIGVLELERQAEGIVVANAAFHELDYVTDPDDPGVRARIDRYRESLRPPTGAQPKEGL